jgi:hypothetical protein
MTIHSLKTAFLYSLLMLFFVQFQYCTPEKSLPTSDADIDFFTLSGGETIIKSIVLSNGNIAVVGTINKNGFISVFNTNGKIIWTKEVGGTNDDLLNNVIETSDGNILAVGYSYSISEGVNNPLFSDGWVLNYTLDGALNWKKNIGSDLSESFLCALEDGEGNFIFSGFRAVSNAATYLAKISHDGNTIIWDRQINIGPWHNIGFTMVEASNGDIVLAGIASKSNKSAEVGNFVTYLAAINPKFGALLSSEIYTDYVRGNLYSAKAATPLILIKESNGYALFTFLEGNGLTGKVQYLKTDFDGNFLLERQFRGLGNFYLNTITILDNEEYLICGQSSLENLNATGFKNSQSTVLKINNQGEEIWASYYGGEQGVQAALITAPENENWNVYSSSFEKATSNSVVFHYIIDNMGKTVK